MNDAFSKYQKAIEAKPDYEPGLANYGISLALAGRFASENGESEAAVKHFQEGVKLLERAGEMRGSVLEDYYNMGCYWAVRCWFATSCTKRTHAKSRHV